MQVFGNFEILTLGPKGISPATEVVRFSGMTLALFPLACGNSGKSFRGLSGFGVTLQRGFGAVDSPASVSFYSVNIA